MDSLGNQLLLEGDTVGRDLWGKTIKLLDDGTTFSALISQEAEIDPGMMLGSDIREVVYLRAPRDAFSTRLLATDSESQIPVEIDGVRMAITKRHDNPANPFIQFQVVKAT